MGKTTATPTKEQSKWIKENYKNFKNAEIADKMGVSLYRIYYWFKLLGIKKINKSIGFKKVKKRGYKFENREIESLPAEYAQLTREQHVSRILSMNI